MAKCNGNCAICTLQSNENKQACCAVQTLKNVIEIKTILKEMANMPIAGNFSTITPIDDTEPIASGAVEDNEEQ